MADDKGSEPKSLEVRVSELEDAVRDLTAKLGGGAEPHAEPPCAPWPPCGAVQGGVPCIQGYVPCIAHPPCGGYVPCIAHPPCGGYVPCIAHPPCGPRGYYQAPPPCGGPGGY